MDCTIPSKLPYAERPFGVFLIAIDQAGLEAALKNRAGDAILAAGFFVSGQTRCVEKEYL